ncbi:hypothetical protein [Labrenzia sp. VG12]|uniref:hypothetical protein n=1 Tax=Labrenzia sp. VG12 TaxID=2021862 RepID=UPI000B8C48C4|nr:hypothetical protein [Labrenzia sp. VG12]ASP33201.1 hypothetical protein CHH27_08045 [Labrenzia sp. VG12]
MKHSAIPPDFTIVRSRSLSRLVRSGVSAEDPAGQDNTRFSQIRVVIALNVVSIVLALLLFGGLFLSWSLNSELNAVRKELAGLQEFEKRILARVDIMNNGVQHRLSKMDQRMGAIRSDVSLVTRGRRDPASTVERISTMIRNDGAYFGTATAELLLTPELSGQDTQRFVPSQPSGGPAISYGGPPEDAVALFSRVTTADGKVRYEMKR